MGIHKEVRKLFGSSVLNYMISARTAQGFEEYKESTLPERQDIINRWREHKSEYQNSRQKLIETRRPEGQDTGRLSPRGFLQTRHLSFEERKKLHEERKAKREEERHKVHGKDGKKCPFCSRCHPHRHTPRAVQTSPVVSDSTHEVVEDLEDPDIEFENAIHESVAATSRGNPEEDMMIERAIRASVKELQKAGGNTSDSVALNRAIKASIAEASRRRSNEDPALHTTTDEDDAEHQALLEQAIQDSLSQYQLPSDFADPDADIDTDDDEAVKLAIEKSKEAPTVTDVDSDEDENIRKAIEKSKEIPPEADVDTDDDEDVKLALEKSKSEHEKELSRAQTEEEIVLEYVKKQSLAEEEHKRKVAGKAKEDGESGADEEALNLASASAARS